MDRFAWIGAFSSGGGGTTYASQYPKLDLKANEKAAGCCGLVAEKKTASSPEQKNSKSG